MVPRKDHRADFRQMLKPFDLNTTVQCDLIKSYECDRQPARRPNQTRTWLETRTTVRSLQDSTTRAARGSALVLSAILFRDLAVFPSSPFLSSAQQVL